MTGGRHESFLSLDLFSLTFKKYLSGPLTAGGDRHCSDCYHENGGDLVGVEVGSVVEHEAQFSHRLLL